MWLLCCQLWVNQRRRHGKIVHLVIKTSRKLWRQYSSRKKIEKREACLDILVEDSTWRSWFARQHSSSWFLCTGLPSGRLLSATMGGPQTGVWWARNSSHSASQNNRENLGAWSFLPTWKICWLPWCHRAESGHQNLSQRDFEVQFQVRTDL